MPSTYTTRGIELMATGEQTDVWGNTTNSNLTLVNKIISANLGVATTGGTTTLTDSEASNLSYTVSGTLTSNATVVFPDRGGFFFVANATSGSYTLTVKTTTGTGVTITQGTQIPVYSDGTNMNYGQALGTTIPTGALMPYFGTGDVTGWLPCNSLTIGSASSGATSRANADTQALFYHLWNFSSLTVSGGRGASAAADWSANKTITTPDFRGRVIAGLDTMGTTAAGRLTSTTITGGAETVGNSGGSQTVALTSDQNGAHSHSGSADVAGAHTHTVGLSASFQADSGSTVGRVIVTTSTTETSSAGNHTHTITVGSSGSGTAHNNVQPAMVCSIYIKL